MQLTHFYTHHHQHQSHTKLSVFWMYELSVWLHVVARSLSSVFIPILLYTTGFPIPDILLFYIILNAFDTPFNFVARALVQKIGARLVIVLATFLAVLFFSLFGLLESGAWGTLGLLAFVYALYDSFYWVSYIYLFMVTTKSGGDKGKETGSFFIIRRLGTIIAPLIGAGVLIFSDKDILYYVSALLFLLSLVPLIWVRGIQDKPARKMPTFKEYFKHPREKKNFLSLGLFSIHSSAESVMWPLFVYLVFNSVESVAFIPVIIGVSTILLTYYASAIKPAWREVSIIAGAFAIVIVWVLRIFVDSQIMYYGSVVLVGLFTLLVTMPLNSNIFTRGTAKSALQTATYRNAISMFSKTVFYSILFVLVDFFHVSFISAMVALVLVLAVNTLFVISQRGRV